MPIENDDTMLGFVPYVDKSAGQLMLQEFDNWQRILSTLD
jgi:hypothetical protein